jgi:flagellar biosynthesis/type III secretory pathway protein FliH
MTGSSLKKEEDENQMARDDGDTHNNETEMPLTVQKGIEAETRGRKGLEEAYCLGYDDGFGDGVQAGYEKGECETWDKAFSAGFREGYQEAKASSALYAEE